MSDNITFDERLQVARELIGDCIKKWSDGSRNEIKILVQDAFQVDKAGKVSTARVLGLRRLEIHDPDWEKAMKAITESIQVSGTKQYLRFYERDERGSTGRYLWTWRYYKKRNGGPGKKRPPSPGRGVPGPMSKPKERKYGEKQTGRFK